jgi:PhzF family phenazine biosynthesis protein
VNVSLELRLVDAFASGPFTGNPAAVVFLDQPRDDAWMQHVAMEMNQAETAFVQSRGDGFGLRWFTPGAEVDLCGHATLASAHALWESGRLPADSPARFFTRSGWLGATREASGDITLDFPAVPCLATSAPANLDAVLGVRPEAVLDAGSDLLCVFADAAAVRALAPDFPAIARWPFRGVVVSAPGDRDGIDFVSRCFFPALAINEDPVTGSAHCALATYWGERLGKDVLVGFQASPRGGAVRCARQGSRMALTGGAVTTVRGSLEV